ncbi:MAG: transglutaminase domain-containing protein, partial [Herbaspirillum sp.]
ASNQELQSWLQLPPTDNANPRTRQFARQLQREFATDTARVNAVLRYFRQQPFRYTLNPPLLGSSGVDEFLFSTRAGFCEHYAGAFVLLMREMDIPARVVTGYQGGEMNPVDGFLTVRQSDAHAWAEVWLDGRGWTRVDPTAAVAPERIERNLASTQPRPFITSLLNLEGGPSAWNAQWKRLRMNWDAVGNAWNQWVLNYTGETQQNLLKSLGFENTDWRTLTSLLAGVGGLFMLLMALPYLRRRPRFDPADTLYFALSRRMAQHGLARRSYEGPHAYRQRLLSASPALHPNTQSALSDFLKLYETLRYGAPKLTEPNSQQAILSQLKFLLRQCR